MFLRFCGCGFRQVQTMVLSSNLSVQVFHCKAIAIVLSRANLCVRVRVRACVCVHKKQSRGAFCSIAVAEMALKEGLVTPVSKSPFLSLYSPRLVSPLQAAWRRTCLDLAFFFLVSQLCSSDCRPRPLRLVFFVSLKKQ